MSDGHDLALALAPQREAILSQLASTGRTQAARSTAPSGVPQHTADTIGAAWFDWLDHGENTTIIRTTAIEEVRQGLTYSTGSTLTHALTQTIQQALVADPAHESVALRLLHEFSAAFLDQVARQHELRSRQDQERLAVRLQVSAAVVRVATSIQDPDQLLTDIVRLIAVRFGFYHVAVFTLDESGRWALLREATGEVGQQLKDRGQALAIRGRSLVGSAIRERQPQIALDVGPAAVQFDDPLLPNTRSEIALPLIVGDQVLGALDLQSAAPAAFDENFAALLQGMVDQLAVALHNAERYQRDQAHAEQTSRLMQIVIDLSEQTDRAGLQTRLVQSALTLLDTDRSQFWFQGADGLKLKAAQSVRPGADQSLVISQELAERVCSTGLPLRLDSPPVKAGYASRITDVPFNAALITPISWQGQTVGVLSVMRSQPGRPFTQDDETAAQLLAAQAATALENITLAEQQQHRALQLQTAAEVSRASATILQVDELLATVVELVRDDFSLYYVGIFLLDARGEWAYLHAGTGEAGRKMLQADHRLRVDESSMIGWSIVHRQARIALDVGTDAVRFDNPALPNTRSEMALPLISRGNIIGAATIQSTKPAAFTAEDITILQTMADQIATAAENARLFERTQTALNDTQAAQGLLSTLIDNIPYPIFYKDVHGAYLGCNHAFERYVGRNRQEFIGKTVADVYADPVLMEKYQTMDQALFDQPGTQVYEMQVTYADGVQHDVIFNKATFTNTAGQLAGLVGTMIDISERKHAETVLRDSEAQLSEALRMARLGYWEYDVERDLFLFNDQFYSIFHTTAEPHGGYQLSSAYYAQHFVHPDDLAVVGSEIERALSSTDRHYSRELEHRILYADGGVGYISVRLYIDRDEDGHILRYYGANQDITERKLSELRLAEAIRLAKMGYWTYDVPTDTFTFNDQFYALMRTTAEEEGGYTMSSAQYTQRFVHPDDAAVVGAEIVKALETSDPNYRGEVDHRVYFADGQLGYITVRFTVEKDADGRTIRTQGANQDITERKLAEETIQQEQQRIQTILRTISVPMIISRLSDSTVLYANEALAEFRHMNLNELIGSRTTNYFANPVDQLKIRDLLRQQGYTVDFETQLLGSNEQPAWVLLSARVINFQNEASVLSTYVDITERKRAEEALRRSEAELSEALNIAKLAYWEYDVEKDLFLFNDQFYAIFHTTAEQEGGYQLSSAQYAQRFVYPDDLPVVGAEIEKALTSTDRHYSRQLDHRIQYADGGVGYISVSINIDRNEQGQILRYYGANQDITGIKLAEVERERLLAEQQARAMQLQTAAEVGRVATSILNPDQLLHEIVNLIAARFDLYHVAAYTIDDSGRWALLRDATGEVGQQLKERGQAVGIRGQSIVGSAVRQRQPRIALDVGPEAVQFDEPLLPDTRSEIVLPLFVGEQVLGALDLYSATPAAFDDNFAILLQGMADQIAVALNNAEQYQREQANVEQTNRLMQIVIDLSEQTERVGLQDRLVLSALSLLEADRAQFWQTGVSGPELKAAQSLRPGADQNLAISQELADRVMGTGLPLRLDSPPTQAGYASRITNVPFNAALITPIGWQGRTIGVVSVMRSQPGRPFTQDDETSAQLLAAQAATALENIALSEQQQHRAVQLQTAAEVSRASSTILQVEELLNTAVELVRDNFGLYYTGIFLLDAQAEWAYLRAGTGEAGRKMLQAGHRLRVNESSMIGWSIVHRQARIALDVGIDAARFDNPLLPNTRSEMALPLISRGHIIGAATIQSTEPAAFTPDDITILQTMADQITTAVENARLLEQTQQSVQTMTALNEVMRAISQEIELEWMLESAYQNMLHLLPVDTFVAALYDSATDTVSYPLMYDEGENYTEPASPIKLDSPIGRVIRTVEPLLENMTREEWAATRANKSGTPDHAAKSAPSQLVVPLRHANRTLGALSVQTNQFNAYTRQHVELMENVASQLSVAIVNSQLLEQTRRAVDELNALNRRLTGEAWQNYTQLRSPTAVIWHANDPTLSQVGRAQAEQLAAGTIAVQHAADEADVSVPIMLRGQLIGALRFRAPADKWTDEAQAIATSLAGHLAQSAENTRLIEQTQQTAQREKQIAEAADKIHRSSDLNVILQTAVQEIARITGAEDVGIQLGSSNVPQPNAVGNGRHPTRQMASDNGQGNDYDYK